MEPNNRITAFMFGLGEFRRSITWADSSTPERTALEAYDWGREWAHRLTLRRFEMA